MIRDIRLSDAEHIAQIYNYYIQNTIITFETKPINSQIMASRIRSVLNKNYPFIVFEENNQIMGYAYLDKWRSRKAYDITLETSIYLSHQARKQGIGTLLYDALIKKATTINIHSLIGVISLPNAASRRLHEKLGFELIGNFRKCGLKFEQLIDVEFWQLHLKNK